MSFTSSKIAVLGMGIGALSLAIVSCVGDDPPSTQLVEVEGGGGDSPSGPPGTPPGTPPPGDGGGEAGPPGGVTLAQIAFDGEALSARAVPAPGGGAIVTVRKNGGPATSIGGASIPCSGCTYLVKLAPDLHVEWSWWYEGGNELAVSPDGHVYWLLESGGGFGRNATLTSGTGTNQVFAIPGGPGDQGDEAGGAIIVVALDPSGAIRWTHLLAETDITEPRTVHSHGIAATDKTVFVSGSAQGTLAYTDINGVRQNKVIGATEASFAHELDATSGRTKDLNTVSTAGAFVEYLSVVGSTATAGEGFFAYIADRANGSAPATNYRVVALDATGIGAAPQILNPLTAPGGGAMILSRQGVFPIAAYDINAVPTFGADTFPVPAGNGKDALYFLFDNAAPKVKAHLDFGGSGTELMTGIADATGGDIYGTGTYRSSDLVVAGKTFPPTPGSVTSGAYVFRAHVDTAAGAITPSWGAAFTGTARVEPFPNAIATDAVTSDVYVVGWMSQGNADFGLGQITTPGTGLDQKLWAVRVRR